jgi:hypothetical protein
MGSSLFAYGLILAEKIEKTKKTQQFVVNAKSKGKCFIPLK